MSVNYASGLSHYEHKGKCGMPETVEVIDVVREKIVQLAGMIMDSRHTVVITGAGISTSAGIPDFRGPKGVWTQEEKGFSTECGVTFESAKPTGTHLALVALEQAGYVKYVISQNVDGLHLRSGLPNNRLAELHGNMFIEVCDVCKTTYIREKAVATMALKPTGAVCTQVKRRGRCRGRLRDTILDWEDALPVPQLEESDKQSRKADLCICLGTSLQIMPCGGMPMLTKKNGGRLVIVNLQTTRLDKQCDLRIHAYVDEILIGVCKELGLSLPKWHSPCITLTSSHTTKSERSASHVVVHPSLLIGSESVKDNISSTNHSPLVKDEKETLAKDNNLELASDLEKKCTNDSEIKTSFVDSKEALDKDIKSWFKGKDVETSISKNLKDVELLNGVNGDDIRISTSIVDEDTVDVDMFELASLQHNGNELCDRQSSKRKLDEIE